MRNIGMFLLAPESHRNNWARAPSRTDFLLLHRGFLALPHNLSSCPLRVNKRLCILNAMPKNPHAVKLGRKGGKKTLSKLGRNHFKRAGLASAAKRKARAEAELVAQE
jgi:hypothetical protein